MLNKLNLHKVKLKNDIGITKNFPDEIQNLILTIL